MKNDLGKAIFTNGKYRVRVKELPNNEIAITVHRIDADVEWHPLGYVLGSNYLRTEDTK